jgi:hypothetical protein
VTHRCYLIGSFDTTEMPPRLVHLDTYGESWQTLTLGHSRARFHCDLAVGEGHTYDEAKANLMKTVEAYPGFHWVQAWLGKPSTAKKER